MQFPTPDDRPENTPQDVEATIQDEAEVIAWFEAGRTYQWMAEEYERRYNITTTPSLWGTFRRSRGLTRRPTDAGDLIPWALEPHHRWERTAAMLRMEARRRSGVGLTENDARLLEEWTEHVTALGVVVDYDRHSERGFVYVPRRIGVDTDLIREPGQPLA